MRSTPLSFCLATACFALLLSAAAPSANAQCGVNTLGFSNAGIVTDNPFHAELVVTRTTNDEPATPTSSHAPELIARDSQGRVRTERATGQFLHENGAEAGAKTEQHIIMICDPVTQTLTQIDTLSASAKIIRARAQCAQFASATRFAATHILFFAIVSQPPQPGRRPRRSNHRRSGSARRTNHHASARSTPPPPTASPSSTPPAATSERFGAPTNFPPSCSRSCRICGPAPSPPSPCKISNAPSRTRPSFISRAITPSANRSPSRTWATPQPSLRRSFIRQATNPSANLAQLALLRSYSVTPP